jgi:hypothetical protein
MISVPASQLEANKIREESLEKVGMAPWQMTSSEYRRFLEQKVKTPKPENRYWMPEATLIASMELDRLHTIRIHLTNHARIVSDAFRRNKNVPFRVLNEYGLN